MPSWPPKKNTALTFYVGVVSQANTKILQVNPTLAAGDVKVAIDDGAPNNLATLPVVDADFTKRVKVSLSAAEMNGDRISIIFADAAGAEWCDLIIDIPTSTRQADDLAFPVTSGRGIDVDTTGGVEVTPNQAVNVAQWNGSAVATPTVAGVPEVDLTHIEGTAHASTQVRANAVQWAGAATASDDVALATAPTNFAALSITAAGLVDITQAAADKVWGSASRTLTAFSTALALSIWDVLETAIVTASSIGLKLKTNLDTTVSGRASQASVDGIQTDTNDIQTRLPAVLVSGRMDASVGAIAAGAITAAAIATDAIDGDALAADAVAEMADQVWDELIAGHLGAGSTGAALNAAGGSGDPWSTSLPGAYGAGTAGKIIGDNLNATVGSRSSHSAADVWAVVTRSLTDKAGFSLSTAGIQAIWDALVANLTTVGSIGKKLADWVLGSDNKVILSNNAHTGATVPAVTSVTNDVSLAAADEDAIVNKVWDEAIADHLGAGSTGAALNGAGAAGDPWTTTLPGAYGAGTAGNIVGNRLDAAVGSRAVAGDAMDLVTNAVDAAAVAADAVVEIQSGLATASAVAAVQADTDDIQTRLPAALIGGRMNSDAVAISGSTIAADNIEANIANLDAAISTRATPAQVNAEVVDVLVTDTYAEPSAVPAATSSLKDKIGWLFSLARNKRTTTSAADTLRNDADSGNIASAGLSDDGTTFTRSEWV